MPRFAQPVKDVLTLLLTIAVGIATGIWVDVRAKPESGKALACLGVLICLQIVVTLLPSKDMQDLEVFRQQQTGPILSKQQRRENSDEILREITHRKLEAIRLGRPDDLDLWNDAFDREIEARSKGNE